MLYNTLKETPRCSAPTLRGSTPKGRCSVVRRIPLTHSAFALVDDEDYERLNVHKWHLKGPYAARAVYLGTVDGKEVKRYDGMHRVILDASPGVEVDHVNSNPLDNRWLNLRLATLTENRRNATKIAHVQGRPCSSRYKGVCWHKGKWMVQIRVNGKRIYLGRFVDEREAGLAYDRAARKYFGEFAKLNFPWEDDG